MALLCELGAWLSVFSVLFPNLLLAANSVAEREC